MQSILPVILCGGSGSRLWPLSTPARPKPFHALLGPDSLLQDTLARLSGQGFLSPLLIGNHRHRTLLDAQAPQAQRLLEPVGRNTALAAAVGSLWAQQHAPDAMVLLAPADHHIRDAEAFRSAVHAMRPLARQAIVTFGMTPTGADTGYGYIRRGDGCGPGAFGVDAFIEKPDAARAAAFVAAGTYSWNAGIFAFAPAVMCDALHQHAPDVLAAAEQALATMDGQVLGAAAMATCPDISLDYAVMEHTDRAIVCPLDIGWADVGSFDEIWRLGKQDASRNVCLGDVVAAACSGCLLMGYHGPLRVHGLRDQIVIHTADGVLALPRGQSQTVKNLIAAVDQRRQPSN